MHAKYYYGAEMKRLLKIIVSIVYILLSKPALRVLQLFNREIPASCIILFYHSIPPEGVRVFIDQIEYLARNTTPIRPGDYHHMEAGKRYSVITFDDAFTSAIDNAVPELLKRRIPFAIFIPAGFLGKSPGWSFSPGDKEKSERVATADELKKIPSEYVTFGSHTVTHRRLSTLDSASAYKEILASKNILESSIGTPIRYIAFPYGDYSEETITLCRMAGYEQVFTIKSESPYMPADAFEKGRIEMGTSDWPIEYKLKILGAYSWMPLAVAIKKKILNFIKT